MYFSASHHRADALCDDRDALEAPANADNSAVLLHQLYSTPSKPQLVATIGSRLVMLLYLLFPASHAT